MSVVKVNVASPFYINVLSSETSADMTTITADSTLYTADAT